MVLPGLSTNMISLKSGTSYGRFTAEIERDESELHCYQTVLRIMGAHPRDSNTYIVEIEIDDGGVKKTLNCWLMMIFKLHFNNTLAYTMPLQFQVCLLCSIYLFSSQIL